MTPPLKQVMVRRTPAVDAAHREANPPPGPFDKIELGPRTYVRCKREAWRCGSILIPYDSQFHRALQEIRRLRMALAEKGVS